VGVERDAKFRIFGTGADLHWVVVLSEAAQ
jgi:hypothetical protein